MHLKWPCSFPALWAPREFLTIFAHSCLKLRSHIDPVLRNFRPYFDFFLNRDCHPLCSENPADGLDASTFGDLDAQAFINRSMRGIPKLSTEAIPLNRSNLKKTTCGNRFLRQVSISPAFVRCWSRSARLHSPPLYLKPSMATAMILRKNARTQSLSLSLSQDLLQSSLENIFYGTCRR